MSDPMLRNAVIASNAIEAHYPEFLTHVGVEDSPIVKAGYYLVALNTSLAHPLPDSKAQELLLEWLRERLMLAQLQAKQDVINQFWL